MTYIQKQSPFWWTRNLKSTIYFLRELTGVVIAFYIIYFLLQRTDFTVVSWIGLAAAIFHTITWLWVTVQLTPVPLKKPLQIGLFAGLIATWIGVSYFLLHFLYIKSFM